MCGIVVAISTQEIVADTVQRLSLMEYRGYDSFGAATLQTTANTPQIVIRKNTGKIGEAMSSGYFHDVPASRSALAHTRWATHGGPTPANAHPHLSYDGTIAVAHNGVIENHAQVRRHLEAEGIVFASDTDTEVIPHLIARFVHEGDDLLTAIGRCTAELTGEYALGVISTADPHTVYGAKRKSPLILGHSGSHGVLASDQIAMSGLSGQVLFLEDGDVVRMSDSTAEVFHRDAGGSLTPVEREYVALNETSRSADKGPYHHWMIKEINETPTAAATACRMPAETFTGTFDPRSGRPITLIGIGSAFYVAQLGQYLFSTLAGIQAVALASDEAEYLAVLQPGDTLVAISQSGETYDTLEVCRRAVTNGASLISISNVPNSTQERLATHLIAQDSGPEICVLSTKSVVSQVLLIARLALASGLANGTLTQEQHDNHLQALATLPDTLRTLITDTSPAIRELAMKYAHVTDWFFLGRGSLYPVACESALKFKEVSYRHAEGISAGFLKHGTISLIEPDFHSIALLPSHETAHDRYAATLSAVSEIAARGGPVLGFGPGGADTDDLRNFTEYLALPYQGDEIADVVVQLVAGQLLAYYCALELGREIDQPRSLAKSVTVR